MTDPDAIAGYDADAAQWRRLVRRPTFWLIGLLLILLPSACLVLSSQGPIWQQESLAFVHEAVPAICTTWDVQALNRRAAPELLAAAPEAKLTEYFSVLARKLGPFKSTAEPAGGAFFNFGTGGLRILAQYDFPVVFQQASGTVRFELEKRAGSWQIMGFYVNSDALLK